MAGMRKVSKPMLKALIKAAERQRGNMCPVVGVHANAETVLLKALADRGLIEGGSIPFISDAGREVVRRYTAPIPAVHA